MPKSKFLQKQAIDALDLPGYGKDVDETKNLAESLGVEVKTGMPTTLGDLDVALCVLHLEFLDESDKPVVVPGITIYNSMMDDEWNMDIDGIDNFIRELSKLRSQLPAFNAKVKAYPGTVHYDNYEA